ncbi:MAG: class II aldolase/adducin family protein [Promethearchaeota archaeon]
MPDQDERIKRDLCEAMKDLYSQRLLSDIGGNLSCRSKDQESIWITPMGVRKNQVTPEDLLKIAQDGTILVKNKKNLRPSVEFKLHLAIYAEDEDYNAVIHTHGPWSTAFSIAPVHIPPLTHELQILVPDLNETFVTYAPSGSLELASAVSDIITDSGIAIMQNHGLVTAASTLEHALILTRAVEETIRVYSIARQLGGQISSFPD